jgi:hypothetical protein
VSATRWIHPTLIARISDAGGEPIRDPKPPLGLCEQ